MLTANTIILPILPPFAESRWIPGVPAFRVKVLGLSGGVKRVKILVIDDEAVIADTVSEILKDEGFDAISLAGGEAAIELAKTIQPDIVISDVIMPGMNGIEIAIRIRALVPHCKIVLFSGQAATVDLLDEAHKQGHDFQIIAKPIKPEVLLSVIQNALSSGKM